VQTLRAKGLGELAVLRHAVSNALPQILAVMDCSSATWSAGSILDRDYLHLAGHRLPPEQGHPHARHPILQGAILILALCFRRHQTWSST